MKFAVKALLNLLVLLSIPMLLIGGLAICKVITPLIVISGSMEPGIHVGSLVVATSVKAKDLHPGDVASFKREDGVLVTHRIVSNEAVKGNDELRTVEMKGDANEKADANPYVQSEALKPLFVVPVAGSVLTEVGNRKFEIIAISCFAIGFFLIFKMIRSLRADRPLKGRRRAQPKKKSEGEPSNQK